MNFFAFLILPFFIPLYHTSHDSMFLIKDLEAKASQIKSYYYERTSFKKGLYVKKEEKEMFIEDKGLKDEMILFSPDGNKKEKVLLLTNDYLKHYDLSSCTLYLTHFSQLDKELPQEMKLYHPFLRCDIRKPFRYEKVKDDNPRFLGIGIISRTIVYVFQTEFGVGELDKGKKRLKFYNCRLFVGRDGFLRRLSVYDERKELIYEERIIKIIKYPPVSSLEINLAEEDFRVVDDTSKMREELQLLSELYNNKM